MSADNETPPGPRKVEASELKADCFKLIEEVGCGFEEIVITKNGKALAKLIPYREQPKTLFGIDRGRYEIIGDLDQPLDEELDKESMFGKDRGKIRILGDIVSPMPPEWYSDTDDSGGVHS